jgi:hypothetical protein
MKPQQRPSIWIILGVAMPWLFLAVNIVNDYIREQRITPFSIFMLFGMILGSFLIKIFKLPLHAPEPFHPVGKGLVILSVLMLIFFTIRIFML